MLISTETTAAVEEMATSPAKDADSTETTAAVEEMTTSPAKDADSTETTADSRRNDNITSERC